MTWKTGQLHGRDHLPWGSDPMYGQVFGHFLSQVTVSGHSGSAVLFDNGGDLVSHFGDDIFDPTGNPSFTASMYEAGFYQFSVNAWTNDIFTGTPVDVENLANIGVVMDLDISTGDQFNANQITYGQVAPAQGAQSTNFGHAGYYTGDVTYALVTSTFTRLNKTGSFDVTVFNGRAASVDMNVELNIFGFTLPG